MKEFWCLRIAHDNTPIEILFRVKVSLGGNIYDLKEAAKKEVGSSLNIAGVRVYNCKDTTIEFERLPRDHLKEKIGAAFLSTNPPQCDYLGSSEILSEAGLKGGETLLLKIPGTFPPLSSPLVYANLMRRLLLALSPAPAVGELESMQDPNQAQIQDYDSIFLRVQQTNFAKSDLATNKIRKWTGKELPSHVKSFINMLEKNPVLPPGVSRIVTLFIASLKVV